MNQAILSHSDLVSYHRDQQLASAVGLSRRQLQKIETGATSLRIEQLQPILAGFGRIAALISRHFA